MAQITLNVPDDLSNQLLQLGDRLPELLALSLQQPALPAQLYRQILGIKQVLQDMKTEIVSQ
jgi:hypothetical protein